MANETMTLISTVTVGAGGASTIALTSIPQAPYTDLMLKISARGTLSAAFSSILVTINSSTTTVNFKKLQGYAGSASSFGQTGGGDLDLGYMPGATSTASTFGSIEAYFPNYSGSTAKSISVDSAQENNSSGDYVLTLVAGVNTNTAPITSLTLFAGAGNFAQYSTASLYGILKGSGGATVS